jgi:hypothetical protein
MKLSLPAVSCLLCIFVVANGSLLGLLSLPNQCKIPPSFVKMDTATLNIDTKGQINMENFSMVLNTLAYIPSKNLMAFTALAFVYPGIYTQIVYIQMYPTVKFLNQGVPIHPSVNGVSIASNAVTTMKGSYALFGNGSVGYVGVINPISGKTPLVKIDGPISAQGIERPGLVIDALDGSSGFMVEYNSTANRNHMVNAMFPSRFTQFSTVSGWTNTQVNTDCTANQSIASAPVFSSSNREIVFIDTSFSLNSISADGSCMKRYQISCPDQELPNRNSLNLATAIDPQNQILYAYAATTYSSNGYSCLAAINLADPAYAYKITADTYDNAMLQFLFFVS